MNAHIDMSPWLPFIKSLQPLCWLASLTVSYSPFYYYSFLHYCVDEQKMRFMDVKLPEIPLLSVSSSHSWMNKNLVPSNKERALERMTWMCAACIFQNGDFFYVSCTSSLWNNNLLSASLTWLNGEWINRKFIWFNAIQAWVHSSITI